MAVARLKTTAAKDKEELEKLRPEIEKLVAWLTAKVGKPNKEADSVNCCYKWEKRGVGYNIDANLYNGKRRAISFYSTALRDITPLMTDGYKADKIIKDIESLVKEKMANCINRAKETVDKYKTFLKA